MISECALAMHKPHRPPVTVSLSTEASSVNSCAYLSVCTYQLMTLSVSEIFGVIGYL